jgi:hypothetical protein
MKTEVLEKRILEQAKTFKSRANKSLADNKRHDRIKSDEKKEMFTAHCQLGWSYSKISATFGRCYISVEKWVKEEQKTFAGREGKQQKKKQTSEMAIQQQKQKEHIRMLQKLARTALSDLPSEFPDLDTAGPDVFDLFNKSMVKVYHYLTSDPYWDDLACHLGDESKRIKKLSCILDDEIPGWSYGSTMRKPKLDKYKEDLIDAWVLMKSGGLTIISESSDTWEWGYLGLTQRCLECPVQECDPASVNPTDYDNSPTSSEIPWRLTKDMAAKIKSIRELKRSRMKEG